MIILPLSKCIKNNSIQDQDNIVFISIFISFIPGHHYAKASIISVVKCVTYHLCVICVLCVVCTGSQLSNVLYKYRMLALVLWVCIQPLQLLNCNISPLLFLQISADIPPAYFCIFVFSIFWNVILYCYSSGGSSQHSNRRHERWRNKQLFQIFQFYLTMSSPGKNSTDICQISGISRWWFVAMK